MRLGERVDDVTRRGVHTQQVEESVAGDVDQRLHVDAALEDVDDLLDVDARGHEQLLAERAPEVAEAGGRTVLAEELARERHAVAVDAAAAKAEHDVVGLDVLPDPDRVERHRADGGAGEFETEAWTHALYDVAHLGNLAAWD